MTLVGFFQGKVFAVENNQLEMDQESSDYLEKIEAFSYKGAEFIVNYAQSKKGERKAKSINNKKSFNRTKTRYNVTVTIKDHVRTKNGSHVASLKNVITHKAYGIVGDSGTYIGLGHDSATSSKTSNKWRPDLRSGNRDLYIDNDKKYTAGLGIAYSRTETYVRFTTKVGLTFTLQAFD